MKVDCSSERIEFHGGEGDTLTVHYDTRGEPYRQGVTLDLHNADTQAGIGVWLHDMEARELRDLLNRLYPAAPMPEVVNISPAEVAKAISDLLDERERLKSSLDWHINKGAKLMQAMLSIKVLTTQSNFTAKLVRSIASKALKH